MCVSLTINSKLMMTSVICPHLPPLPMSVAVSPNLLPIFVDFLETRDAVS